MNTYYAYIRVSTAKQGEGVSLQEQRDCITRYARQHELAIQDWFEEQETAAKQGRPQFTTMLRLLKQGKADGVIIHKIDRSARNLRDWADLGELIDKGIDVQFANESLDLNSRGGRLWGDHLRKQRLDRGLEQKEVAAQIGVSETSIYNWENHRTSPRPQYLPKLIAFLGYVPYDPELSSGERLRYKRQCLGYSQAAYARYLGIDPGTVGKWERE